MRRAVVMVVLVALTACGGTTRSKAKATTTSTTGATSPSSGPSTSSTAACNFAGTTAPQRNSKPASTQLLTDVKVAASGCLDTVTFSFRASGPAPPGYSLSYQPGPFASSGSGQAVSVAGAAFLAVRFEPAAIADLTQANAPPSYTGPRLITPTGTTHVRGLALYDAFEGVVAWVIGLDRQAPVQVSAQPGSLVVTIGPA